MLRVYGDDTGDRVGSDLSNGVAYGDVNGDGFDDIILGAMFADAAGGGNAGEVYVVYGGAGLVGTQVDLNSAPGSNGETRIIGDDAVDWAGWSVASGDVNGDGFDDIIAGAPGADPAGGVSAGEVYVVYGSAGLAGAQVDLSNTPGSHGETRIFGDDSGDRSGWSVASGDVNGDGFHDVIIGADGASTAGDSDAGEVYVIYGSAVLAGTQVDLNSAPGSSGETRILGSAGGDQTGFSVASGDVNGDGLDDVIIGAIYADPAGGEDAGEVYVIYGSAGLAGTQVDLNSAPGSNGETRILGDDADDRAGVSVASGDVNGDGFNDVIIGAYSADPSGKDLAGETYIVYGSAGLPGAQVDLNSTPGSNGETRVLGDDTTDRAGFSVAAGDVNGDGLDDVMLGAPFAETAAGILAGEVYLVYGSAGLPGTLVDLEAGDEDVRVLGADLGDVFGFGGEVGGDVDRDGFGEFAASAWLGDNPSIGSNSIAGYVVNLFGAGTAAAAAGTVWFLPGNATARGFGGRLSPVLRTHLGFIGGSDGGGNAAPATAIINRGNSAITGLGAGGNLDVADVYWELNTSRTGWTEATVTFQYIDAEIAGLNESDLHLWQAPTPTGPWSFAPEQTLDTNRNEVSATLNALGFFALSTADDLTPPNAVDIVLVTTGPTQGGDIEFVVTFDEAVMNFDDEVLVQHTDANTSNTGVSVSGSGPAYTVTVEGVNGNGAFTIEVDTAGDVTDYAGNALASSVTSEPVVVDNTPPAVDISAPSASLANTGPVTFTVIYTGADTVMLAESDIVLNAVGDADAAVAVSGSGNSERIVTLSGISGDGTLGISIPMTGTAADAAGNLSPTAGPSVTFTVDNTAPSVGLSSSAPPYVQGVVTIDAMVDEAGTTFGAGAVTPANATVHAFSGSGTVFSFTLTPQNEGAFSATVAAGAFTDAAGNPNTPSGTVGFTYDATPPEITNFAVTPATAHPGATVTITFTVDEDLVDDPAVTVDGAPATLESSAKVTNYTYTWNVPEEAMPGTAPIAVTAVDLAGNVGTLTSDVLTITAGLPVAAWPVGLALLSLGAFALRRRRR